MRAPWIILARPGIFIETRLSIVRNDKSLRKPQIYYMDHETPTFSIIPTVEFAENSVMPPSKYPAIIS